MATERSGGLNYSKEFIAHLELIWGEGFLSPGGAGEVAVLFEGLALDGLEILDIGSGPGTIDLMLLRDYGAARVIGIDLQEQMIVCARGRAARAGLSGRVSFQLVEPGPLPFDEAAFDLVMSREALFHVPDPAALFAEMFRTLRPGGSLVLSSWFSGPEPFSQDMLAFLATADAPLALATPEATVAALQAAGFENAAARDRGAWYHGIAEQEVRELEGPKRARLVEILGAAGAEACLARTRHKIAALDCGDLRPAHLRACKPA